MREKLLNKKDIASLFNAPEKAAEEQLAKAGLRPINLGPGRGRGKRWLQSAVMEAIQKIHEKAQQPKTRPKQSPSTMNLNVAKMTTSQLQDFLKQPPVFTTHPTIQ